MKLCSKSKVDQRIISLTSFVVTSETVAIFVCSTNRFLYLLLPSNAESFLYRLDQGTNSACYITRLAHTLDMYIYIYLSPDFPNNYPNDRYIPKNLPIDQKCHAKHVTLFGDEVTNPRQVYHQL